MREINVSGHIALVDDEDFERVSRFKWYYCGAGYAQKRKTKNDALHALLHRFVMNVVDQNVEVDHINCNKLDNRKENLRIVNHQQNHFNRPKMQNTSSRYKGVSWNKSKNKWSAKIMKDGRQNYLGRYDSEEDAARA